MPLDVDLEAQSEGRKMACGSESAQGRVDVNRFNLSKIDNILCSERLNSRKKRILEVIGVNHRYTVGQSACLLLEGERGIGHFAPLEDDAHATSGLSRGFAEDAHIGVGVFEDILYARVVGIVESGVRGQHDGGCGGAEQCNLGYGQMEHGSGMELELGEVGGMGQGDHAGVVGAWRQFGEHHAIGAYEELDAEDASAAEGVGDLFCHLLRLCEELGLHLCGDPALMVVAIDLMVAYGRAEERGAVELLDCEECDLVVELDEALDYDLFGVATAALCGYPGVVDLVGRLDVGLAFAGRGHEWFDDAGNAYGVDGLSEFVFGSRVLVFGGAEAKVACGEVADSPAVHRDVGCLGGGDDLNALLLVGYESFGAYGLDFGNDDVRFVLSDDSVEFVAVEHA